MVPEASHPVTWCYARRRIPGALAHWMETSEFDAFSPSSAPSAARDTSCTARACSGRTMPTRCPISRSATTCSPSTAVQRDVLRRHVVRRHRPGRPSALHNLSCRVPESEDELRRGWYVARRQLRRGRRTRAAARGCLRNRRRRIGPRHPLRASENVRGRRRPGGIGRIGEVAAFDGGFFGHRGVGRGRAAFPLRRRYRSAGRRVALRVAPMRAIGRANTSQAFAAVDQMASKYSCPSCSAASYSSRACAMSSVTRPSMP